MKTTKCLIDNDDSKKHKAGSVNSFKISMSLLIGLAPMVSAADQPVPLKAFVVKRLLHSERVVPSAIAHYRVEVGPSPSSDIERVRQVLQARYDESDPRLHCAGVKMANTMSHSMVWKRKNDKELFEKLRKHSETGQPIKQIEAFDGAVVRTIKIGPSGPQAVLKKPYQQQYWRDQPELSPLNLVYRRSPDPWSRVIDESNDVQMTNDKIGEMAVTKVSVPRDGNHITQRDELFYDEDFRLLRRDGYGHLPPRESTVRLMERYEFKDFRSHVLPSGETVWYPYETAIQLVFGICPDGVPAIWCRMFVRIDKLEIAPEIPDSEFVPELPPNAVVKDELVTNAVIPQERQQVAWQGPPKTISLGSWVIPLATLLIACVLVSGAVIWYRKRLRVQA